MQPVICQAILVIVCTVERKEEMVVKNTESGLNQFGDLFLHTKQLSSSSITTVILLTLNRTHFFLGAFMISSIESKKQKVEKISYPSAKELKKIA